MNDKTTSLQAKNSSSVQATPLLAGVAKREITTDRKEAAIRDPLWAKALVLENACTRVVLLTLDAVAIGGICDINDEFLPALRERLERELGVPATHVLVNASHTHPPGRILCSDEELLKRAFDAVLNACANLTPVTAGVGKGHNDRLTMNRNLKLKNGRHWTIRHGHPGPPEDAVAGMGEIDPEIGVLRIDRIDGSPLAVVYNFACHFLFGDPRNRITANFCGIASDIIEATLGGDAMAIFVQGAAGDVIDVGFKDFTKPRDIVPFGRALAASTLEAYRRIETSDSALCLVSETIELPRRTDSDERIAALRKEQSETLAALRGTTLDFQNFLPLFLREKITPQHPQGSLFSYLQAEKINDDLTREMDDFIREKLDHYVASVRGMEKLARIEDEIATFERHKAINAEAGTETASAEIAGVKIGECVFVTAPIEILTEVALNIKAASPYENTFIAAFTNGYMHYGPPAADYDKGGYEVTECFLAPQWQEIYEAEVADILRRL
jgi:hypothetical protein